MFVVENDEISLINTLNFVESFTIFNNGKSKEINKNNKSFFIINEQLENLFKSARLMPAFGVSLHNETLNELKYNNWLQINFEKELNKNGLNFTSLLFKLDNTSGFNLIRLNNGRYDGRCLYLDLSENIDLQTIIKNN